MREEDFCQPRCAAQLSKLRRRDDTLQRQQVLILAKLSAIETHQKESIELLTLFKNSKGFITTLKWVGRLILWTTSIGAAVSAIVYAFKLWIRGES